ncbi:polysaccharide biosynthesis protein [Actinomycetospora sp. C-140]
MHRPALWEAERRHLALLGVDCVAWVVALAAVIFAPLWAPGTDVHDRFVEFALVAIVGTAAAGTACSIYRGLHRLGSAEEAVSLAIVFGGVGALVAGLATMRRISEGAVPLTATLIAAATAVGARLALRRMQERRARRTPATERVLVFGAGHVAIELVRSMLADPRGGHVPVAIIDDSLSPRRRRIHGVGVYPGVECLSVVAPKVGATALVVATRRAQPETVRRVCAEACRIGLSVHVLPPLAEQFRPRMTDLRSIELSDLLGRRPLQTNVAAAAGYLRGRRVLVTGAGGSIGSELCRQVSAFGPAELMMLDRDESALHAVQLAIYGSALLDTPDVILADIRDRDSLLEIFLERRPEVVFHVAALKHLPMLEQYPDEAWKTNVLGTLNVMDSALQAGTETFVNVSTDKAANPTSVLGRSKRLGERAVAARSLTAGGRYLSVRFGNVLGSRGSVLTTFTEQLCSGGPLTITHPDVTRFFMTIPEAVELVIQAGAVGGPGEVLVLDMGDQVRIADVAHQLMALSGRRADIVYTGLRSGEKLHEELYSENDAAGVRVHPLITHVAVPSLDPSIVRASSAADMAALTTMATAQPAIAPETARPTAVSDGRQPA